jgi:cyanophycinase
MVLNLQLVAKKRIDMARQNTGRNTTCPRPEGMLYIIGGKENKGEEPEKEAPADNEDKMEVLKGFVELINKKDPQLEVITTAGSEGQETFQEYQSLFNDLGISKLGHIHHDLRQDVLTDSLMERVAAADAFFFTGGNQLKLTGLYGGTPFLTELKNKYIHEAVVIAGTSAGAMALSTPMIYAGSKEVEQVTSEIKVTTGLEFLKDVCIDTHFVHRGRFIRMAQVIVTNPTSLGIGIEEDTAVIVRNGNECEITGTGTVVIIEGFGIAESNLDMFTEKQTISIRNLTMHLLSRGDQYIIPQINPPHL